MSNEQKVTSNEHKVTSNEQRATSKMFSLLFEIVSQQRRLYYFLINGKLNYIHTYVRRIYSRMFWKIVILKFFVVFWNPGKIFMKKFIYSKVQPATLVKMNFLICSFPGFLLQIPLVYSQSTFFQNTYSDCFLVFNPHPVNKFKTLLDAPLV